MAEPRRSGRQRKSVLPEPAPKPVPSRETERRASGRRGGIGAGAAAVHIPEGSAPEPKAAPVLCKNDADDEDTEVSDTEIPAPKTVPESGGEVTPVERRSKEESTESTAQNEGGVCKSSAKNKRVKKEAVQGVEKPQRGVATKKRSAATKVKKAKREICGKGDDSVTGNAGRGGVIGDQASSCAGPAETAVTESQVATAHTDGSPTSALSAAEVRGDRVGTDFTDVNSNPPVQEKRASGRREGSGAGAAAVHISEGSAPEPEVTPVLYKNDADDEDTEVSDTEIPAPKTVPESVGGVMPIERKSQEESTESPAQNEGDVCKSSAKKKSVKKEAVQGVEKTQGRVATKKRSAATKGKKAKREICGKGDDSVTGNAGRGGVIGDQAASCVGPAETAAAESQVAAAHTDGSPTSALTAAEVRGDQVDTDVTDVNSNPPVQEKRASGRREGSGAGAAAVHISEAPEPEVTPVLSKNDADDEDTEVSDTEIPAPKTVPESVGEVAPDERKSQEESTESTAQNEGDVCKSSAKKKRVKKEAVQLVEKTQGRVATKKRSAATKGKKVKRGIFEEVETSGTDNAGQGGVTGDQAASCVGPAETAVTESQVAAAHTNATSLTTAEVRSGQVPTDRSDVNSNPPVQDKSRFTSDPAEILSALESHDETSTFSNTFPQPVAETGSAEILTAAGAPQQESDRSSEGAETRPAASMDRAGAVAETRASGDISTNGDQSQLPATGGELPEKSPQAKKRKGQKSTSVKSKKSKIGFAKGVCFVGESGEEEAGEESSDVTGAAVKKHADIGAECKKQDKKSVVVKYTERAEERAQSKKRKGAKVQTKKGKTSKMDTSVKECTQLPVPVTPACDSEGAKSVEEQVRGESAGAVQVSPSAVQASESPLEKSREGLVQQSEASLESGPAGSVRLSEPSLGLAQTDASGAVGSVSDATAAVNKVSKKKRSKKAKNDTSEKQSAGTGFADSLENPPGIDSSNNTQITQQQVEGKVTDSIKLPVSEDIMTKDQGSESTENTVKNDAERVDGSVGVAGCSTYDGPRVNDRDCSSNDVPRVNDRDCAGGPAIGDKYVGAHVSISGGLYKAVEEAVSMRARAFGLFLKSQRTWKYKHLEDTAVERFRDTLKECGYSPYMVVPHGGYLMNLASPEEDKREKSLAMFIHELRTCDRLGLPLFNFHPGSTCGMYPVEEAIKLIAKGINAGLEQSENTIAVLENMAAQGFTIGGKFEELRDIINLVENKSRVGVCFDTCHAVAAGYDLSTKEGYESTMKKFEDIVGFKYLKAVHINDSRGKVGCRVDRHEDIGAGTIGKAGFEMIMNDPRFNRLPFILETPTGSYDKEIKKLYKYCK